MKYLLDTDWAVHYLRGNKAILSELSSLIPEGVGISIVSVAELYAGLYCSEYLEENVKGLKHFLKKLTLLHLGEETVDIYGRLYANLRRKDQLIDGFDLLIAAACLEKKLILLTQNRRHFDRIRGLEIHSI